MKRVYTLVVLVLALTIVSCSKDTIMEIDQEVQQLPTEPLTIDQINQRISNSIEKTGDFDWNKEDAHFLWSALTHGQYVLTVGYGNDGQSFSEEVDKELE